MIAYNSHTIVASSKSSVKRLYINKTPNEKALFMSHEHEVIFEKAVIGNEQAAFDYLYTKALGLLDKYYPEFSISVTSKDPYNMTPDIKSKLRKKNRLMYAGRRVE